MSLSHPYTRKACASCIDLKAKCNHTRPCERCVNRGVLCSDVVRKPRQKNAIQSDIMPFLSTIPPRYTQSSTSSTPSSSPTGSRSPPPLSVSPPPSRSPPPTSPVFQVLPATSPVTPHSPTPTTPHQDEIVELENYLIGTTQNALMTRPSEYSKAISLTENSQKNSLRRSAENSQAISLSENSQANSSTPQTPLEQVCPMSPATPLSPSTTISVFLNAVKPVRTDAQTKQTTTAVMPILDALMNLVRNLEQTCLESEEVVTEVKALKKLIDVFLPAAQPSLPKEIHINSASLILDPQTIRMRDCNESFVQIFGGISKKQKLLTTNVKMAFKPFVRQLVTRDFAWFMKNGITFAERYIIIPHIKGTVLYALGTFQVLSPNYVLVTISTVFEGTPHCLQVTYNHYLGLNEPLGPAPECTMKYCHCKLLHLPLLT